MVSTKAKSKSSSSVRQPQPIKVSKLLLDTENFRLREGHGSGQDDLLRILDEDFRLREIGESIADNGYFPEEPLSAIRGAQGEFIVVEGNRRLAALKLLLDGEARAKSSRRKTWDELANRVKHDISEVPVIVYANREELVTYLGYRHFTGILRWDPFSKATFINTLVETAGKNADFHEIARGIGSHFPTVRDHYIVYRILLQARDEFEIDVSKMGDDFSVFYRALASVPITQFIGLKKDKSPYELRRPISSKKRQQLADLIGYIYGTEDRPSALKDSRLLTELGEVLVSPTALRALKTTGDVALAYQLVGGGEPRRLIDNLNRASFYLDEALSDAHRHNKDLRIIELVERCVGTMAVILKSFPMIRQQVFKP
jgi:hypothetical protein